MPATVQVPNRLQPSSAIVVQRTAAGRDSDTATERTVRMMCEYINAAIADGMVNACAHYAFEKFGRSNPDPAAKCWAVWWYVKHCVKFRLDEGTMFSIGERDQQDLLIAPAVLTRMKDPAEDCDGFTMLCAAMLRILGVNVVIATIAADGRDPSRWSHVFALALLPDGSIIPMDASHGKAPGWMVPARDIHRWQAWNLDGTKADIAPMRYQGLHNYVPARRGVGATLDFGPFNQSTSWASFIQDAARSGIDLVGRILTPPAYQQVIRDPATGQLVSTTVRSGAAGATNQTALTAGAGAVGTPNTALWIGAAVLGVIALSALKSR